MQFLIKNYRILLKSFLVFLLVMFIFVFLGQQNHPKFQEKAYLQAREAIMLDYRANGGKGGEFIEPFDFTGDIFHAGVVTGDGTRYVYEVSITNPVLVQLSALNLFVAPEVRISAAQKSQP